MVLAIAERFSQFAVGLKYGDLPEQVTHAAKRFLLDMLGCAVGGYGTEAGKIIREVIVGLGGKKESTIIGGGAKTSCTNAILANGVMARTLDYNDVYDHAWHPSEISIFPALAVGERKCATGKDLITAITLGYEFSMRLPERMYRLTPALKGLTAGWVNQYVSPIVAGKVLGLDANEMANAIGISGSIATVIVHDAILERVPMTKNMSGAYLAMNGALAALLAEKGFTGPENLLESDLGHVKLLAGGCDFDRLINDLGKPYKINESLIKRYSCCYAGQSAIGATLLMLKEHNLAPKDIEAVDIKTFNFANFLMGGPTKYRPNSIVSAQFSLPYCISIAIMEGDVIPKGFTMQKIRDEKILKLASRIKVESDPELDKFFPDAYPAEVEILTKDGKKYRQRVDYQKGHPQNPMTDNDLKWKFRMLASEYMGEDHIMKVIDTLYNLEKVQDVNELSSLLIFREP